MNPWVGVWILVEGMGVGLIMGAAAGAPKWCHAIGIVLMFGGMGLREAALRREQEAT